MYNLTKITMKTEKPEAPFYYLTLFKLEGHSSWRAHLSGMQTAFDDEALKWTNAPKITEKQVIKIDRLTGTFVQDTSRLDYLHD